MKVCYVTNYCPHYRIRTYEVLSKYFDVDFYFYSKGNEWYWQQQHGVQKGQFPYEYLKGYQIGKTRITPALPQKLLINDYDIYIKCINGKFALPITYLLARIKKKPFILWTGIWMRLSTPIHRILFPFTRYIYRHSDAIVVYGEHVKRYLLSEGVCKERIFIAAHAVDNTVYKRTVPEEEVTGLIQELNINPDQKVVLYLGRLEDGKGLDYLLSAYASISSIHDILVLAGEGSLKGQLIDQAKQLGIFDKVRFPGYIKYTDTVKYYALGWVFVLPSITTSLIKETWGLVVNEAFNQGLPVIASDAVGAAAGGLVRDGINGFIVPERDTNALSQRMCMVLEDADLRTCLSHNATLEINEWDNERMVLGFRNAVNFVSKHSV